MPGERRRRHDPGFGWICVADSRGRGLTSSVILAMVFHTHIPRPPLDGFVELLWRYESYAVPHAMERVLPTGTMELVTILGDGARGGGGPIISGAHSQSF